MSRFFESIKPGTVLDDATDRAYEAAMASELDVRAAYAYGYLASMVAGNQPRPVLLATIKGLNAAIETTEAGRIDASERHS